MATPDLIGAIVVYGWSQFALMTPNPITGVDGYQPVSAKHPLIARKPRMSGTRQSIWAMPTQSIVVNGPRGGPVNADPPIRRTRIDLECYGTTEMTSKLLAEAVVGVFVSAAFRHTPSAVDVGRVDLEAEPIWLPDPDVGWPRTVVPLIVNWTAI